jgi:hypothetical protein
MNPLAALALAGIVSGAAMSWIFRRTANGPGILGAANRIQAHLLEFWLFVDEPRAIWKSWKGLLAANARLLGLLLVPFLILSIPALPLFFFLDAFYGTAPLPVGQPALVTLGFDHSLSTIPELRAAEGIAVETQAVRVISERQVSWRIRPLRPLSGELQCIVEGKSLAKSVTAGEGFQYHSQLRARSIFELVRYPTEALLPAGPVEWIEISYPTRADTHWSVWFIVFSLFGAVCAHYFGRN